MSDRDLDWEGCRNVRDLGGLRTADGRHTRRGGLARADAVDQLTAAGWAALRAHGIRTIVDLRNEDERGAEEAPRPGGLTTVHVPLDGIEHIDFWDRWASGPQFATPLYYAPFLDRFPDRTADVIRAIGQAQPGGVVFHCVGGRDRTGLITLLLLALVGVAPGDIADDYELSANQAGRDPAIENFLSREGTSARQAVLATLAGLDVEAHLRSGGLDDAGVAAARARLL